MLLDDNIAAVQALMQQAPPVAPVDSSADDALFAQLLAKNQAANAPAPVPGTPAHWVGQAPHVQHAVSRAVGRAITGSNPSGARYATGIPGGKLTEIKNKTGQKWTVAAGAAQPFQKLLAYLDKVGYHTKSSGGYVDRDIRGRPGVKSEHAYGRAIDVNADTNPLGSTHTDLPANIGAIARSLGLVWGGNFKNRKDPMHFEYDL